MQNNASTVAETAPSPPSGGPSINLDGIEAIAEAILKKNNVMRRASMLGGKRRFRTFRTSDVIEMTHLNDRTVREWRKKNRHTIESFKEYDEHRDDPNAPLPQLPLTLTEVHRLMADHGIRPRRPVGSRAIRLGVFNFKGGSTKSSTTLHLGTYLAIRGWRVLLIDADPQGSLSSLFGFDPEAVDERHTLLPALNSVTAANLFDKAKLLPLKTHVDGLDIVPANLQMIGCDFEISAAFRNNAPQVDRFYECVDRAIETVEPDYDIVLIDGAPAFSFSALATMWSVHGMIIPVPPASPDFKATGSFCDMLADGMRQLCRRARVPNREFAPYIFVHNRVKKAASADAISDYSKEIFGRYRVDESIPDNNAIPNALALHMSVYEATASKGIDSRALKAARDAYDKLGSRIEQAIAAAWNAGFAKEAS